MNACKLESTIKKKRNGAICQFFDNVMWAEKESALEPIGFVNLDGCKWHKINAKDAVLLLTEILHKDLCYEGKVLGKGLAKDYAKQFVELNHWQSDFFTNSDVPYHLKSSGWSFSSITETTIDTGVIVKIGKELSSILWVVSQD